MTLNPTHIRTLQIMNKISSYLELPNYITTQAKRYYFKYRKNNKITNSSLLSGLCFLKAINENDIPIGYQELINAYQEFNHRITRRNLGQLRLKLNINFKLKDPTSYIPRYINVLCNTRIVKEYKDQYFVNGINYDVLLQNVAFEIFDKMTLDDKGGIQPKNLAIMCVYFGSRAIGNYFKIRPAISQSLIGEASDRKEYTVRDLSYRTFGNFYDEIQNSLFIKIEKSVTATPVTIIGGN